MKLLSVFTLFVLFFVSSSYKNISTPDPEDFAKSFLEVIKKKDRQLYEATFYIQPADVEWLMTSIEKNNYIEPEKKERLQLTYSDTASINSVNELMERSYTKITDWIEKDSIDLNALEYIQFNYKLEHDRRSSFYGMERSELYVKHRNQYYCIQFGEIAYLNGRWVLGKVKYITIRDQYLNDQQEYYYDNITVDSIAVNPSEYAADTMAIYDTVAPVSEYYDRVSIPMTKKQKRTQGKIDSYKRKINKLEDAMYRYEFEN